MVAVDAVIIEVLSCNNAPMRYIFKGENVSILLLIVSNDDVSTIVHISQRQVRP